MSEIYRKNQREWKRLIKVRTDIPMKNLEILGFHKDYIYYKWYSNKLFKMLSIGKCAYFKL